MKAYSLSIRDDPDQGEQIVFARTARDAKKLVDNDMLIYDNYIDLQVHRAKNFDDMESLDKAHFALEQWKYGWRWFDMQYPDPDEASDEEFLEWYKDNFESKD